MGALYDVIVRCILNKQEQPDEAIAGCPLWGPEAVQLLLRNEMRRLPSKAATQERSPGSMGRIAPLAGAIASGGELDVLTGAVRGRREALQAEADRLSAIGTEKLDRLTIKGQLQAWLKEWREMLNQGQLTWTRQILAKLLDGRKIVLTPIIERKRGAPPFKVEMPFTPGPLMGTTCPKGVASPTGFEPVFWP